MGIEDVTQDDIMAELVEYFREEERPKGSVTAREVAIVHGQPYEKVRRLLANLYEKGIYQRKMLSVEGRRQWVYWKDENNGIHPGD